MSRLAVGKDDHPEAARKHIDDARVLLQARRHDGVAYHAGYVVECSLKAVLLHDRSYDPVTGATDVARLAQWHKTLKGHSYSHDLTALSCAAIGPEGARYLPALPSSPMRGHDRASVLDWSATMRYQAAGSVDEPTANAYYSWAEVAMDSVVRMSLDGVL